MRGIFTSLDFGGSSDKIQSQVLTSGIFISTTLLLRSSSKYNWSNPYLLLGLGGILDVCFRLFSVYTNYCATLVG